MKNKLHQQPVLAGSLLSVIAVMIWSGNYVIASGLGGRIPPVSMAFYRWSVAVIACLPFALKAWIAERHILLKHWRYMLVVSVLGVSFFNTLIYMAGRTSTALNLSLISMVAPVSIVLLSALFLKDRITWFRGVGIVLVVAGVILLLTQGHPLQLLSIRFAQGDLLMLVAALSWAIYSVMLKRKPEGISAWAFQLGTFVVGLVLLLPFYLWELSVTEPVQFTAGLVLPILYVGVFASLLAFYLWGKAIALIGPSKTGIVANFMPLFSGILAFLFLGQGITLMHLYSGVMILAGVVIANTTK